MLCLVAISHGDELMPGTDCLWPCPAASMRAIGLHVHATVGASGLANPHAIAELAADNLTCVDLRCRLLNLASAYADLSCC